MGDLNPLQYGIITAIVIVLLLLTVVIIKKSKQKKVDLPDVDAIFTALKKDNIESIEYQRSKLVIKVRRAKDVDLEALKETGAIGINVVGNKIKFYYDEDNEKIYQSLKEREGNG